MTYKNKLIFLVSLIAVLALLFSGSIIFNSDIGNKQTSFVWLDAKNAEKATRIVIKAEGNTQDMQDFELSYNNNQWFVLYNDTVYPARKVRIDDFLSILTTRSAWNVRSTDASNHERFGLDQSASKITIYAENTVILDLLLGNDDIFKNETYFRKAGQNEVRSGDSGIKTYVTGPVTNWYNLRLIPENEGALKFDLNNVQRLSVYNDGELQIFNRRNRTWAIEGVNNPNVSAVESYIRAILNTEGDNFAQPEFGDSESVGGFDDNNRIVIEFGNGRIITIRLTEPDDTGRRYAQVSGRSYVYSIPSWSAGRLYKNISDFESQ